MVYHTNPVHIGSHPGSTEVISHPLKHYAAAGTESVVCLPEGNLSRPDVGMGKGPSL